MQLRSLRSPLLPLPPYHSLQLAGLQPPSLPQVGLPHDVQLADHRHALDDARLLGVLRLGLQAVQILPRVHGLQVGHLPEGGLQAGGGFAQLGAVRRGGAAGGGETLEHSGKVHLSPSAVTVLSSVTLYIMDGSSDTFSMNMGEVVMFWI